MQQPPIKTSIQLCVDGQKKTQVDNIAGYEDINISLRISSNCYFTQRNFCDSGLLQFFLLYSSFSQKKTFRTLSQNSWSKNNVVALKKRNRNWLLLF